MSKLTDETVNRPLTGNELLSRVMSLGGINRTKLARACGYVTRMKSGNERVQVREFLSALVEAQGIQLDIKKSHGQWGRSLTYRASVQKNGTIIIGAGYTKQLNFHPGDCVEVQHRCKDIKLVAIDFNDEDEFDDDKIA